MIARRDKIALGAALAFAIAMPAVLLPSGTVPETPPPAAPQSPLSAPPQPTLAAAFARPLFAGAPAAALPQDAPALVGIVGRLDQDAVAMVQTAYAIASLLRSRAVSSMLAVVSQARW